jgi:hypothetical protein
LVISLDLLTSLYTYTPKNHWLRTMRKTSWSTLIWCSRLSTLEEFEVFQTFWMVPDILSANLRQDAEHSLVERLAYLLSVLCHSFGPWTWCATLYCCTMSVASRQCLKNLNLICSCTTRKVIAKIANTKVSWKCERCIVWQIWSLSPPVPLPYQNQTQQWRAYSPVLTFINYLRSLPKLPLHAPTAITHVGGFVFTSSDVLPFELVLNLAVFYSFVEDLKQPQRLLRTIMTCSLNTDDADRRRSHRNRDTFPQLGHAL